MIPPEIVRKFQVVLVWVGRIVLWGLALVGLLAFLLVAFTLYAYKGYEDDEGAMITVMETRYA